MLPAVMFLTGAERRHQRVLSCETLYHEGMYSTSDTLSQILHCLTCLSSQVMDDIWNETMSDKRGALEDGRDWHQTMAEVRGRSIANSA